MFSDNNIFGGFAFSGANDPFGGISAGSYENIYGDEFEVSGSRVINIGTTLLSTLARLILRTAHQRSRSVGSTPNEINAVQLRYNADGTQKTTLVNFKQSAEYTAQTFDIDKISGKTQLSFVFMPGTDFNFDSFKFFK